MRINNYIKIVKDFGIVYLNFFHDDFAQQALERALEVNDQVQGKVAVYRLPYPTPSDWDNVGTVLKCWRHNYEVEDNGDFYCRRCLIGPTTNTAKKALFKENTT